MSPEQSGRMNRALDYRTDLYSLGITFYQLLTGSLRLPLPLPLLRRPPPQPQPRLRLLLLRQRLR